VSIPTCKYSMSSISKPSAFTLVEMLVVIAIITILASMLMPIVRKSQNSAYCLSCTNNLKQTSFYLQSYSSEYNNWCLPSWYSQYWIHKVNVDNRLNLIWFNYILSSFNLESKDDISKALLSGKGYPILTCSMRPDDLYTTNTSYTANVSAKITNYGYNCFLGAYWGGGEISPMIKMNRIRKPSRFVTMMDYTTPYMRVTERPFMSSGSGSIEYHTGDINGTTFGHNGKFNTLLFDGHTERKTLFDFYSDSSDRFKEQFQP